MRNSKNRYFYHIFVSPRDAPGAITLNVVWMEREFHAYKLSRCMCPSNYNHGMEKLEGCRYPIVKKFWRYVYSFWRDPFKRLTLL